MDDVFFIWLYNNIIYYRWACFVHLYSRMNKSARQAAGNIFFYLTCRYQKLKMRKPPASKMPRANSESMVYTTPLLRYRGMLIFLIAHFGTLFPWKKENNNVSQQAEEIHIIKRFCGCWGSLVDMTGKNLTGYLLFNFGIIIILIITRNLLYIPLFHYMGSPRVVIEEGEVDGANPVFRLGAG